MSTGGMRATAAQQPSAAVGPLARAGSSAILPPLAVIGAPVPDNAASGGAPDALVPSSTVSPSAVTGSSAAHQPSAAVDHQFDVLDGLRGIAALCVFFYHSGNHAYAANGFLAVDFFFMLSGFVVAFSYKQRLLDGRIGLADFARRRFVRLYPMVLAGVMLGALTLVAHNVASPDQAYATADMAAWIASGLLVLPYLLSNPFLDAVFPVNVVLWSLFLELVANGVYAAAVRRVTLPVLGVLVCGGLGVIVLTGHVDGGGSIQTFWTGFARVAAGFAAGVLLFELRERGWLPRLGAGLFVTALPLVVLTFLPPITNPLWIPLIYATFFAIITAALHPHPGDRMIRVCRFLGIISYPLYLLHRPLTALTVGFGKMVIPLSPATYPLFVAIALALSVGMSVFVVRYYETPLRLMLGRLLNRRRALGLGPKPTVNG